jgi:hypothetical protein
LESRLLLFVVHVLVLAVGGKRAAEKKIGKVI